MQEAHHNEPSGDGSLAPLLFFGVRMLLSCRAPGLFLIALGGGWLLALTRPFFFWLSLHIFVCVFALTPWHHQSRLPDGKF